MLLGNVTACDSTVWEKSLSKSMSECQIDDKLLLRLAGGEHEQSDIFKNFFAWLLRGGSKFPLLYLNFYSESYRAINAKRDIAEDEDILYVPHDLIMTSEIARASEIGRAIIKSGVCLRSRHTYLATYLLAERAKENSFWKPYIDILPQRYDTIPLFFDDELLAELEGSMAIEKIRDRHDSLRMEYGNLVSKVPLMRAFDYESFVWARLVIITRIFGMVIDGQKTEGLVPMADMLNHKRPRQTKWTYVAARRGFVITTLQAVGRGMEVFDSYGRKCNSRFFVNYGFVPEVNEDNEAVLTFTTDETSELYREKCRLTAPATFPPESAFQIPVQYDDLNSKVKQAFGFVRFLVATKKELQRFGERFDSQPRLQPVSFSNEARVLEAFAAAATTALASFPHTLQNDKKLLADLNRYPYFSNQRNITLMRSGEKTVLQYYVELYRKIGPVFKDLALGVPTEPDFTDINPILPKSSQQHMKDYFNEIRTTIKKETRPPV